MAMKKRSGAAKKAASGKTGSSTPSTNSKPAAGEKEKRTRKPPLDRALKLASLLTKKVGNLRANVGRWSGDPTKEQRMLALKLNAGLAKLEPASIEVDKALQAIKASGYEPKGSAGRVSAMPVGTRVIIKDGHYDPVIHGDINDFIYTGKTEKFLLLRQFDDAKAKPIAVRRPWIKRNEAAKDAEADAAVSKPSAAGEDPDPGEDVSDPASAFEDDANA